MRRIEYKYNIATGDIIALAHKGDSALSEFKAGEVFQVKRVNAPSSIDLNTIKGYTFTRIGVFNIGSKARFRRSYKNERKHFL